MRIKNLLAALLVVLGVGISAAPASAHLGDWSTQRDRAANSAYNRCVSTANANPNTSCYRSDYITSGAYGEHSREFDYYSRIYNFLGQYKYTCLVVIHISHDYTIFYSQTEWCINGGW